MGKYKNTLIAAGVAVVLLALFIIPRLTKPNLTGDGSGVPCLVPNADLVIHVHPVLTIIVDGREEEVPANIGLGGSCDHALHTHDISGTLHVESQVQRDYTLQDFFKVWGQPIQRPGYTLTMTVDGKPSAEFGNLILKDKQQIVLEYKKEASQPLPSHTSK